MAKTSALLDPFRDMVSLRDEMDRIFDTMLGSLPRARGEGVWAPLADVEETDDALVLRFEVPGMRREDIRISVTGDTFTITGERKREVSEKTKAFHHIERAFGRFVRSLTLPTDVEAEKARATYKDGVLEVVLPKSTTARTKEIAIVAQD